MSGTNPSSSPEQREATCPTCGSRTPAIRGSVLGETRIRQCDNEAFHAGHDTAQTRFLKLISAIARREYLPAMDKCRTIQDARAEVLRFDDRHAALAQTLKAIWDEFHAGHDTVSEQPAMLVCSKCHNSDVSVRRIGKGFYCAACWAKIEPKFPPRMKDSFEFYDKIYHPTTGKPPGTWKFAEAYAEYRDTLIAASERPVEAPSPTPVPDSIIGNILDHWEMLPGDTRQDLKDQDRGFYNAMERLTDWIEENR
jgi:protein-arginine kinase activator protein McsA